jgi:hypothetical protein
MITLVFLACLPNGYCQSQSPPFVFTDAAECEQVAYELTMQAVDAISRGEMPMQSISHKCIQWGEPL